MKKKSTSKTASRKSALAVKKDTAKSQGEVIDPSLEFFAEMNGKTHVEIVATVSPKFAEHQAAGNNEAIESFAGLFWGSGLDFGIDLPEWTKTASKLFWHSTGLDFLFGQADGRPQTLDDIKPRELGKFVGLMELLFQNNTPETRAEQATSSLAEQIKTAAANFPPDEAKQFFDGRASASKVTAKFQSMSQRAKVFMIIAAAWRQVEKMTSAGELHRWLVKHDLIARMTDPAETRAVCRMIEFNPREKAGRPVLQ